MREGMSSGFVGGHGRGGGGEGIYSPCRHAVAQVQGDPLRSFTFIAPYCIPVSTLPHTSHTTLAQDGVRPGEASLLW